MAETMIPSSGHTPVRVGLVGYGWWGKTIARQLTGSGWLQLAAVAEPHAPTRAAMAADDTLGGAAIHENLRKAAVHDACRRTHLD